MTPLDSVGEAHLTLSRNNKLLSLDALAVDDLECGRISRLVVCLSVCQFFVNVLIKAELMQKQYRYMYMYSKTYYFVEQIMKNEKMFFH